MAIFPSYHDELRLFPLGFRRNPSARIDLSLWSQSPPVALREEQGAVVFSDVYQFPQPGNHTLQVGHSYPLLSMRDSTHDRRVFFPCAMSGDVGAVAVRSASALGASSLELTVLSPLLVIHRCEGRYAEDLDLTPSKQRIGGKRAF